MGSGPVVRYVLAVQFPGWSLPPGVRLLVEALTERELERPARIAGAVPRRLVDGDERVEIVSVVKFEHADDRQEQADAYAGRAVQLCRVVRAKTVPRVRGIHEQVRRRL